MNIELLKLLGKNARLTDEQLAGMLNISVQQVKNDIAELENKGILRGYKAVIDWDNVSDEYVSAIIQLNVVPKADLGFEEVAQKIAGYPEVESVYLMSGVYDLSIVVKSKSLQGVARFVARELSTIDSVTATSTHFVLRRYKEMNVALCDDKTDSREYMI